MLRPTVVVVSVLLLSTAITCQQTADTVASCQTTSSLTSLMTAISQPLLDIASSLRKTSNDGVNIALNRPASQQDTYTTASASYAVDGNKTSVSCTRIRNKNPWWQVDLGSSQQIDTVIVTNDNNNYTTEQAARLNSFTVSLSNVPSSTSPPVWLNYPTPCAQYPGVVPLGATVALACPFTAPHSRYVTIQGAGDALCLKEVEVYARN
jgi:hypothetical protein